MLMLGLQGSPRLKGNTNYLLSAFMKEAKKFGVQTQIVQVCKKHIEPCKEYIVCEKKGFCPIDDDMKHEIYPLLREADVVVAATPVFFYNATAQLKALIDRSQTLWARRYRLNLNDPGSKMRRGFLLAVGATKGKNLFEGLHLTAKYFFDAINASYAGSLTYRQIEHPGDMQKHPSVEKDVSDSINSLLSPFSGRSKVLFLSKENACRAQMAAAFTQYLAGERIESFCAGTAPAPKVDPNVEIIMQEKGIDMAFRRPKSIQEVLTAAVPDLVVSMDDDMAKTVCPEVERQIWKLPQTDKKSTDFMSNLRDEIERKVVDLVQRF